MEMLNDVIESFVTKEIEKGISDFKEDYQITKDERDNLLSRNAKLTKENAELHALVKNNEDFKRLVENVSEQNFELFVDTLGFKGNDIKYDGMDSERIPVWFKLINTYYEDRSLIFTLMDMFKVSYPNWAKTYVNPQNYGDAELDLIFNNLGKMYVCNGQIYSGNMGFFYRYMNMYKGDIKELFRESYVEIPWNLFLQNKKLTTEKYFTRIVKSLKGNNSRAEYFYRIQDYQKLSDGQIEGLIDTLPKGKLSSLQEYLLSSNKEIFKTKYDLAESYKLKITSYGGTYYYKNFPISYQIDFIKNQNTSLSKKIEMVTSLEVDAEEKKSLISEMVNEYYGK